jgi:hypothetical protein
MALEPEMRFAGLKFGAFGRASTLFWGYRQCRSAMSAGLSLLLEIILRRPDRPLIILY